MMTSSNRSKATRGAAALAATLSLGSLFISNSVPAGADPPATLVGVGSDTTQDVMNGLAGFNNGTSFTPARSSVASGAKGLASFDAIVGAPGTCITPRAPGATFDRPNGSTNGRRALSAAINSSLWTVTGSTCPSPAGSSVGGIIDFARSSSGPSPADPAGGLMYLPLGRDALSFAWSAPGVATPVTSLTSLQLQQLFINGPTTINGVNVIPCSIQTGSGTFQSWNTAIGVTAGQMATSTATCGATIQENDGNSLRTRANNFPGSQVVIGFSAANFIAQSNGVAASQLTLGGVDLGAIDALGQPYTGTAPNLTPSAGFYANTTYGRTVYNVVQASKITGPGNNDLKTMFANTTGTLAGTPAVCSTTQQTTVNAFGFASLPAAPAAQPASPAAAVRGYCGDAYTDGSRPNPTPLRGALILANGTI